MTAIEAPPTSPLDGEFTSPRISLPFAVLNSLLVIGAVSFGLLVGVALSNTVWTSYVANAPLHAETPSPLASDTPIGATNWTASPLTSVQYPAAFTQLWCSSLSTCVLAGEGPSNVDGSLLMVKTALGDSWRTVAALPAPISNGIGSLSCKSIQRCVLVGYAGRATLAETSNGGRTWNTKVVSPALGHFGLSSYLVACSIDFCMDVAADSTGHVFLNSGSTLRGVAAFVSSTEAVTETWGPANLPRGILAPHHLACSQMTCYLLFNPAKGPSNEVARTSNLGQSWQLVNSPRQLTQISGMSCWSMSDCAVLGDQKVAFTHDGGQHWIYDRGPFLTNGPTPGVSASSITCWRDGGCAISGVRGHQQVIWARSSS